MTKNSANSLISKPKRTIKPTAKIAPVQEEEEESSGPDQVDSNGDGDDYDSERDSGGDNNDGEDSSEGGADEDEEEEIPNLPVMIPQKRKKASQKTNKSIPLYPIHYSSYQ
jgi:hypothetical protein